MRNFVLIFALPILIFNMLFIYVGFVANIGFVGSFVGGLMAIGTDPIIVMIGIFNSNNSFHFRNYKIYY